MIRVEKDLTNVPSVLLDEIRLQKHQENCAAEDYICTDDHYKKPEVKTALDHLYHRKCAYCEKELLDTHRHIEHYRPKRANPVLNHCDASQGYYWLCFSWDNLLLCCAQCNGSKNSCFDIEGERAAYQDESLPELHAKSVDYDNIERPLLINPEREVNLEGLFSFKLNGKYQTDDPRMVHTISRCNLERKELIEKRTMIKNKLISDLESCFADFTLERNLNVFFSVFRSFLKNLEPQKQFFAWKSYLWKNLPSILWEIDDPHLSAASLAAYLRFTNIG